MYIFYPIWQKNYLALEGKLLKMHFVYLCFK